MITVDLTMGCVTRLGLIFNRIQNYPRHKALKDLAPLFIFDETNWFYPRCEIKWNNPETLIAWLGLVTDEFPEVSEEIELIVHAIEGKTSGRVSVFDLLSAPAHQHLLLVWDIHEKKTTVKHPGGDHPYSK